MPREIELKLQVAPHHLARLKRIEAVLADGEAVGHPSRRKLVSTYFDTPDRALRAAGISLRLRRSGRHMIQTVKAGGRASSGLSDYAEAETPVSGTAPDLARIPDAALREAVIAICDGTPLQPLFATEIARTTRLVTHPAGAVVEVAFDQGAVIAGRRRAPLCEVEFELKLGAPGYLFDLARRVAADMPARLRSDTKAARGFRLVERREVGPVKAVDPALDPDCSVEEAFQAIMRGCIAHLIENEPAVSDRRDAEGVHQMRVALRRFRSALKLFGDVVRSETGDQVEQQAKTLGQLLGAARDLDVFETEICGPVADGFVEDNAAFRALMGPVHRRRNAAYRAVLGHLASPAYTAFLLDAGAWIEAWGWRRPDDLEQAANLARPAADFAREVLDRHYRKLRKAGRHLDRMEPEARHDLRKRLKRFRYAIEFLAPVLPEGARAMVKRLARLQDALGVLNDGKTARGLLTQAGGARTKPSAYDWTVGIIVGWHTHAASGHLATTMKLWKRFTKAETFWRD